MMIKTRLLMGLLFGGLAFGNGLTLDAVPHAFTCGGGVVTGGVYRMRSAIGQGVTGGQIADTNSVWDRNTHMFTGVLQPSESMMVYDVDDDLLPDVADPDNDGDGISDYDEIHGTLFNGVATNPNDADSDGNGMSDYAAWVAGTNPTNPASRLVIEELVYNSPTDVRVRFRSVEGKSYELIRAKTVAELSTAAPIDGTLGGPGSGPFKEGTTEFFDVPFGENYFYMIRIVAP